MPPNVQNLFGKGIIPALRNANEVAQALELGLPAAILLKGDIFDLDKLTRQTQDKLAVLLHIDLIDGVGRDKPGLAYLSQNFPIAGIVSTRSNLIKEARSLGLLSILRLFILDSTAYATGINLLNSLHPDAVEMLPGVAVPYIQEEIARDIKIPVIASGLIKTAQTIQAVLSAGAAAVSTSQTALWSWQPNSAS